MRPRALLRESGLVSKNGLRENEHCSWVNGGHCVRTCSALVLNLVSERGKCFNYHLDEVKGRTLSLMPVVEFINETLERTSEALVDSWSGTKSHERKVAHIAKYESIFAYNTYSILNQWHALDWLRRRPEYMLYQRIRTRCFWGVEFGVNERYILVPQSYACCQPKKGTSFRLRGITFVEWRHQTPVSCENLTPSI